MHKLVNIFMIAIIVSCPMRCMIQGCECYSPACCQVDNQIESNCCSPNSSEEEPDSPTTPAKCQSNCFCTGVIVADSFELNVEQVTQSDFQAFESNRIDASYLASARAYLPPPDWIPDNSANRGRQIRCLISSFVI